MKCISEINVDYHSCMPACSGLILTSHTKSANSQFDAENLVRNYFSEDFRVHNKLTNWFPLPAGLKGILLYNYQLLSKDIPK